MRSPLFGLLMLGLFVGPVVYFLASPVLGAAICAIAYPGFVIAWLGDILGRR
jgi:hypothetical protein